MRTSTFLVVLLAVAVGAPVSAQRPRVQFERESLTVYSGIHDGSSETRLAFRDVIDFPGAPWMRLHIAEYHLGADGKKIIFDGPVGSVVIGN